MATTEGNGPSLQERRNQVMVGDLPADFLRVGAPTSNSNYQVEADFQAAQALQAGLTQQSGFGMVANMPRLSITIVQAKLTKNYGITRMDPYCRIRIGHSVFETQSAFSGGKNPHWNKTVHCYLPPGVDTIYLEIFDERTFMMDDRVAWTHITIPETVMAGDSKDDWYMLGGKQGENKEGMVNLVLSYVQNAPSPQQHVMYTPQMQPVVMMPSTTQQPYQTFPYPTGVHPGGVQQPQPHASGGPIPDLGHDYTPQQPATHAGPNPAHPPTGHGYPPQQQPHDPQQQPAPCPPPVMITGEDVSQIREVFPDMDEEAIRSVLEANRGNKELAINDLLSMSS